jgi:hypothetical protein
VAVVSVVDMGVFRVSNTGDGMESNEGLGAGRLRSNISDVGMNSGKSTEKKPFSASNNGGQAENEEKGGAWNQGGRPTE